MARIATLPQAGPGAGWQAILPPRTPRAPLQGNLRADLAVVGAGYTGLAAARRFAALRPADRIVVCDALAAGEGAAGLNSGFAIDHAHSLGPGTSAAGIARAQTSLYRAGLSRLRDLVAEHRIDCDWRDSGKYHCAVSANATARVLEPLARDLADSGEDFRFVDRDGCAAELGTPVYDAAVYTPGTVLLNPAALVRGLADALPPQVELFERTPVVDIVDGPTAILTTPGGRIEASRVLIATNAYAPAAGAFAGRILPFIAFASLTRPLTGSERRDLGGRPGWGITPVTAYLSPTIQRTGDQRILFRDGILFRPGCGTSAAELSRFRARHIARFRQRFPMLDGVSLEYTWGGLLAMSANQHSGFGRCGQSIWAVAGHQGVGITRGTIAGELIADFMLGNDHALMPSMLKIASPPRFPPRPMLDIGVRARLAWERWQNRQEY